MADTHQFLVEIGTEELPPKALRTLSDAFGAGLRQALEKASLTFAAVSCYATPRRLAIRVDDLAARQPDRELERRGPPVRVAIDDNGSPTKAGLKFAESCHVPFDQLGRIATDKGEYLHCRVTEAGASAESLLPGLVETAVSQIPIPRRMRWGSTDHEFVRPVHWFVMLLDESVVDGALFGVEAGRETRGHRFHSPGPLVLTSAADYPTVLQRDAFVVADFDTRRALVRSGVYELAATINGQPVHDMALLDEVTALVEWPVAVAGRFEDRFLELPREVLISTLQAHQRYFPVESADGRLLARFIAVSNIESREPARVADGNERVVRPRLSDAAFFWDKDRATPLAAREAALDGVIFQKRLGTMRDKSARVAALAGDIGMALGLPDETIASAQRAAALAKCDLLTEMVGEFPDLQGIMGRYYAIGDGEPETVAMAIEEQYRPRFAGDALPETDTGRVLALADKLDTLSGIFAIGQRPTGTKDPFGLRRAALGALRILIEVGLELDLAVLLQSAAARIPDIDHPGQTADAVFDYMMERLRAYYTDGAGTFRASPEMFEAVHARHPASPLDFHRRIEAVRSFADLPEADSLSAANKRVANILRQAGEDEIRTTQPERFVEAEERTLHERLETLREEIEPLLARQEYGMVLQRLATLREPVDAFFDTVLVMSEDPALRSNRLALLGQMRALFLRTADLSRLGG